MGMRKHAPHKGAASLAVSGVLFCGLALSTAGAAYAARAHSKFWADLVCAVATQVGAPVPHCVRPPDLSRLHIHFHVPHPPHL